jgi:hypothetical protein
MFKVLGRVIHHWKGVFMTFQMVYYKPPKFLQFELVNPKQICSCSATIEQDVQKNRNGKSTTSFFRNVFYKCIEGKVEHLMFIDNVHWQFLDDRSNDHLYRKDHCQNFGY